MRTASASRDTKETRIKIELEAFGDRQHVHVLVVDPAGATYRELALADRTPATRLSLNALCARIVHRLAAEGELGRYAPLADPPVLRAFDPGHDYGHDRPHGRGSPV